MQRLALAALIVAAPCAVFAKDAALGSLTVGSETATLRHVSVTAIDDPDDRKKIAYDVRLSDAPIGATEFQVIGRVRSGELHFIEATIGADRRVRQVVVYHRALGEQARAVLAGDQSFDARSFGPRALAGLLASHGSARVGTQGPVVRYSADFTAALE